MWNLDKLSFFPKQQKVVDMFDSRPGFQRIVRLGLLGKQTSYYTFETHAHTHLFPVLYLCYALPANLIEKFEFMKCVVKLTQVLFHSQYGLY